MKIGTRVFKGEQPKVDPKKLPQGFATVARNCSFSSGSLEAASGLGASIYTVAGDGRKSLFRHPYHADKWLNFAGDVDLHRGPLANDAWNRIYWTGDSNPKYATQEQSTSSLKLGVPIPEITLTATGPDGSPPDGAVEVDCAYYVTYVTKYGEEGMPSQPSNIVTRRDGESVRLTNLPTQPSGAYEISKIRIYRTEGDSIFNHVVDLPIGTTTYLDSVKSEALAGPCPTESWAMPDAQMKGLTYLGNGMFAGFFGNTLAFSEPYFPHAWPPEYQLAFTHNVVGIAVSAAGLIVTTEAEPWVVSGSHPSAMSQAKLDSPYACVAKRSIVDMGDYVVYASNEGLVAAAGGDARLITSEILSADDFKALKPETFKAYRYDELYLVLTETGIFTFGPQEGIKHYDIQAESAYFDSKESALYMLQADGSIREFGEGSSLTAIWKSGIERIPGQVPISCFKTDVEGTATVKLYLDGAKSSEVSVSDDRVFRLPPGRAKEFQYEIETTGTVHSILFASSPSELVDV